MNQQLQAINFVRNRLDEQLQMHWSAMFALAYENTLSAARYANHLLQYGHILIDLCVQINALPAYTGRRLHKAWDASKNLHKEMSHCRNAKTVHDGIPDADYDVVMQYFTAGAEEQCNKLLVEIRNDQHENEHVRMALLRKFMSTVEAAFDLELIEQDKLSEAYQVLNAYWTRDDTTDTVRFVEMEGEKDGYSHPN